MVVIHKLIKEQLIFGYLYYHNVTGRQTGRQTDRQTGRQTDRQAGRQTD